MVLYGTRTKGVHIPCTCITSYHICILQTFVCAQPTVHNLTAYIKWDDTKMTGNLLDQLDAESLSVVHVKQGEFVYLPAGVIHAVWTSQDALAFAGSFLHDASAEMHVRIAKIEEQCKV